MSASSKPRLEPRVVGRQRGQRGQMATGRATGDGDEIGVAAVLGDVCLHPCQGALDVDDVVGPRVAWAVPVVDRHADPAELGKVAHQRMRLSAFVAGGPRTAGDLEQHRRLAVSVEIGSSPDIEMIGAAVFAVADVAVVGVVAIDPQHPQSAGRLGGAVPGWETPQTCRVGAAMSPQAVVQGGGQWGGGPVAGAVEVQQTQCGQAGHDPRRPAHRTREATRGQ